VTAAQTRGTLSRPVNVSTFAMPKARLSHAMEVDPGARLLFVSGLTAKDAEGETVGVGDVRAQAEHILGVIDDILAEAGGSMADVVRLTVYLRDASTMREVAAARERFFPEPPYPASTMVEVSRLMSDDQLVEIEAVAALPPQAGT
jgi:enamine deaminase RidA (YjgF/YER057c/UK114 family)